MCVVKIFIATHKKYEFPDDNIYEPIHVGSVLCSQDFGYLRDDMIKENISHKNRTFCELTALFSIWKNPVYKECNYIGLCHYRRYFMGNGLKFKGKKILSENEVKKYLKKFDIIVPQARNYFIESVYTHYKNAHYEKDMIATRKTIEKIYPEYIDSFDSIMKNRKLHLYNMFVMKREYFSEYMEWLFDILFELESQLDISCYDDYQKRVFGFLSERLFNVWLHKRKLKKKELKVINIEGEKYILKAFNMLKRKYSIKKGK